LTPHILGWLLILFGACGFYALVLHKLDHRYEPNGTIFTVIGGNSLIICGLYGMEQSGALAPGTVAVVTAANVAAGIPIANLAADPVRRAQGAQRPPRGASMARLTRGGREAIDQLLADLDDLRTALDAARAAHDEAAVWARRREPLDVERKLRDGDRAMQDSYRAIEAARRKVGDHIEPLLQRREDHAPTIEARLAAVEADLDALRARLDDAGDAPLLRRVK
jgi:hypothetical protein